jgi:hypothetical protein
VNVAKKDREAEARLVHANFATATKYTTGDEPDFRALFIRRSLGFDYGDTASKIKGMRDLCVDLELQCVSRSRLGRSSLTSSLAKSLFIFVNTITLQHQCLPCINFVFHRELFQILLQSATSGLQQHRIHNIALCDRTHFD